MQDPDQIRFVAALSTAAVAVPVVGALALIRSRLAGSVVRAIFTTAILLVIFIGAPMLVEWFVIRLNSTSGVARIVIHPGPLTIWSPSVLALLTVLLVAARQSLVARPD